MHIESKEQQIGALRLAYVRSIEEIMLKYKGTERAVQQFRAERDRIDQEQVQLQQRLQAGQITQADFEVLSAKLQSQLQQLDLRLTQSLTEKILAAIEEVGRAYGYDLIFQRKDVLLFLNPEVCHDITDQVISTLDEEFFHVKRIGRKEIDDKAEGYWRAWGWHESQDEQKRILEGFYRLSNGRVKGRIAIDLNANTKAFFIWDETNCQWQPQCVSEAETIEGAILAIEERLSAT